MNDGRLKDRLAEKYPEVKSVYEKCSGFIHLSDIAFYQTVNRMDQDGISLSVGDELPMIRLSLSLERICIFAKYLLNCCFPLRRQKKQFEDMLEKRDWQER